MGRYTKLLVATGVIMNCVRFVFTCFRRKSESIKHWFYLLRSFENTFDRKRIFALPSPNPNSNPNLKHNNIFELTSYFEIVFI